MTLRDGPESAYRLVRLKEQPDLAPPPRLDDLSFYPTNHQSLSDPSIRVPTKTSSLWDD